MSEENIAVAQAPEAVKPKAKPGPKPKVQAAPPVSPEPYRIILPTAANVRGLVLKPVGDSGVVEMGMEGITSTQTLGDFEFPQEFDNVTFTGAYGCEEAGTVGAFRSVAELCQPQRHPAIGLIHPGWRVWESGSGKKHQIKKERGTLTLLFCLRKANDVINAAYGKLSQKNAKGTENKILTTYKELPAEEQLKQHREDDIVRDTIMQFEASQGGR